MAGRANSQFGEQRFDFEFTHNLGFVSHAQSLLQPAAQPLQTTSKGFAFMWIAYARETARRAADEARLRPASVSIGQNLDVPKKNDPSCPNKKVYSEEHEVLFKVTVWPLYGILLIGIERPVSAFTA